MISVVALSIVLAILGGLPLLGGPGYEAALLCGVLAPAWLSVVQARRTQLRLQALSRVQATPYLSQLLVPIVIDWGVHGSAVLGVALCLGYVQGFCEPLLGLGLFALGPLPGMLLGGFSGGALALGHAWLCGDRQLRDRRTKARDGLWTGLGVMPPLLSAVWAVERFYRTPTVFAYDQFAGYFAGPLYDTVEFELSRLLSFRAGTVLLVLVVVCWTPLLQLSWRPSLRLAPKRDFWKSPLLWLGVVCSVGYTVITAQGEVLGHRRTAASMRSQLGNQTRKGLCTVVYAEGVLPVAATRVAAECVEHLRQHQAFFQLERIEPVVVYLFEDDAQKRLLMGAGRTNIAKPWRREIYVTDDGFPHPILGHELAHVVTAAFGRGPFRVAGHLGGWLVDPGRVEGFAEAAALREDSFGTLEQWAAAMKRVGRLPRLEQLFQLGFLGQSAARSYTAAGAFVRFFHQHWGAERLKRWYAGATLEELTGESLQQLERRWYAELDGTPVPQTVLETAAPRFSRPGLFERKCPHAFDRTLARAHLSCGRHDALVRSLIEQLLRWDPGQEGLKLEPPRCLAAEGGLLRARAEVRKLLEQSSFETHELRRAHELLGDWAWQRGEVDEARVDYQAALRYSFEPAQTRQLTVKVWGLVQARVVQTGLRALFFADQNQEQAPASVVMSWAMSGPESDMARYLLARWAMGGQRWAEVRSWLDQVSPDRLPLDEVRREAAHMRLVAGCEQALISEQVGLLERAWTDYQALGLTLAERIHAARLVDRCVQGKLSNAGGR